MSNLTFKTIEECELALVAATQPDAYAQFDMDRMPARAARVSFGGDAKVFDGDTEAEQKDYKLMQYLADHQHMTPFEYQHATFMIECPLFIRSQIHRHRTFSFNEISRRYTSDDLGFWKPTAWRGQASNNRQASEGLLQGTSEAFADDDYNCAIKFAVRSYAQLLSAGVSREMARAVLPQSLLTRFYMGGNLRNWAHFLKLRMDSHAQQEVQVIANRINEILVGLWPNSMGALMGTKQ